MWTRSLLKDNAKVVLHRTYWRAFLVCAITGLLCGGGGGFSYYLRLSNNRGYGAYDYGSSSGYADSSFGGGLAVTILIVFLVILLIAIAYNLFIATPLLVGKSRYFMEARGGNSPVATLFSLFGKPGYLNVVKAWFLTQLSIFLWSLLLLVPGIIKSYEYCMVPYILAERPDMDSRRARELSRQMTDGEKWNIFVLELSFYGWVLLSVLTLGIGMLFLAPYVAATYAELYTALRTKAMANGQTGPDELPGFISYP